MSVTDIMYLNNNPSFKQVPVNALNKQLDFSSPIIFICFSGSNVTDTGVGLRILNELELHVAKPNQLIAFLVLLKTGVELKFCDQYDQKMYLEYSNTVLDNITKLLLDKQLSGVEIAKNEMK